MSEKDVDENHRYHPVPEEETWRVKMIVELLNVKNGSVVVEGMKAKEIKMILNNLCSN